MLTRVRLAQINSRKYIPPSEYTQNYQDRIEVGSIVSIQNPELVIKKANFKLRPKFKNRFLVTERTRSSVILVPCAEIFLEDYYRKHKLATEEMSYRIKADISNVKILTNTLLVNSNKSQNFYKNFFQDNQLPPTFYISQDDERAQVRRLEEMAPQYETDDIEYQINLIRRMRKKQTHSNTSILSNIRKKQVFSIVQHLRPQQVVKKVRFDEKVTCLKLVSPSEIYHCLYPKHIPLKDSFDPPIRKLENNVWCVCTRCRMLLPGCGKESACDMCFGSGRV